jgi:methionyl-tRNA formyltransferase
VKNFKSVFIGCVNFSAEMLNELINTSYIPELVITRQKSNFNSDFYDLSSICKKNNIKFLYTENVNSPMVFEIVSSVNPDVIFCFGWSNLIKVELLGIPKYGVIGYHPALLPANRGRHPIIWALVLGLKITGSTFFIMDEGPDTGDIISQIKVNIDQTDDANILYNKLTQIAKVQLNTICKEIETSSLIRLKQSNEKANYWRRRSVKDGEIDFRMSSESILSLVRALNRPYPGAHFIYKNEEIKVWQAIKGESCDCNLEPGKVLDIENQNVHVKTGDGSIWILNSEINQLPIKGSYLI